MREHARNGAQVATRTHIKALFTAGSSLVSAHVFNPACGAHLVVVHIARSKARSLQRARDGRGRRCGEVHRVLLRVSAAAHVREHLVARPQLMRRRVPGRRARGPLRSTPVPGTGITTERCSAYVCFCDL